ncbi:MAG: hypothetical protein LUD50_00555 [Clostridia bacterium]|nr:hypothetical protein [Clostridia bacterium]
MKICAIDIGSNSVRMAIIADGKTLYKAVSTTRLGEGIATSALLKESAMERTSDAVAAFVVRGKAEGADETYAFATAAVRSAANGNVFCEQVKEKCGIDVDVIKGLVEANAGLVGALKGRDGGIIDVGGASTEVNISVNGASLYAKSVNIGTVRLFDLAGRDRDRLDNVIAQKIQDYGSFDASPYHICTIGGTATNIASVKHGLKVYDPAIVDGTVIGRDEVLEMGYDMLNLSVDEVRAVPGMDPNKADVFAGGCILLGRVMENFGIREATVSESDNIEGYIMLKRGALS